MKRSRRWYLIGGGLLVALLLLVAIFADRITAVSPDYWDARMSVLDGSPPFPPGPGHPLGSDDLGRDIWSRVVYGTRWSLFFGFLVMTARMLVAVPVAVVSAYGPRRLGWLVDRLYVMSSAVPPLLIYLLLLSHNGLRTIGLWPSVVLTVTLLSLVEWPRIAVVLKARINQLSAEPFVEGAVASGGTQWHIFRTHLVPHLWPTLLNLMTAEMARAMLMLAQLGIFGILVGGGVTYTVLTAQGNDRYILTTGIPEWSTLLSDGRYYILSKPWIPFPPAIAFLIAVTGFTMLSQGLEGARFSIDRLKEWTTGRLSERWRWALLAVPVLAALWFYQGLPGGREAAINTLAAQQAERLSARDLQGYMQTVAPSDPSGQSDARLWAEGLVAQPFELVGVEAERLKVKGSRATAIWTVSAGFRDKPPISVSREVELVRRWGRWYQADKGYRELRGYHVDVTAAFDPVDPTIDAATRRQAVYYLATAADHGYVKASAFFPGATGKTRPQVRLYPTQKAFFTVAGAAAGPEATAWFVPGDPLRISPDYLKGYKRWETERALGYEMIKYLTFTELHQETVDPVAMGLYELTTSDDRAYEPEYRKLAGAPLMPLTDLFDARLDRLPQGRQWVYAAESAVLVQFLQDRLPEAELRGPAPGKGWDLASLAHRLGTEPATLATAYDGFMQQRMAATSILTVPAARQRVPDGLLEAIAARAQAAVKGDEAAFLNQTESATRSGWSNWLSAARQAGLTDYDATFLDVDSTTGIVYLLEQLKFGDSRTVSQVVAQPWTLRGSAWMAGAVVSPFQP
jgi:peptide/nickel transport system permease protein